MPSNVAAQALLHKGQNFKLYLHPHTRRKAVYCVSAL